MLGEKIGSAKGKITGQRVLPTDGQPRIESSVEAQGTLLGVKTKDLATYTGVMQPNGNVLGEGHGVLMGENGESATYRGTGVGSFTESGGIRWRGTLYYQTTHSKWDRLNGLCVAFEYDQDADKNTKIELFEWK